jgi:putative glutamine amidotransferase
MKKMIGISTRVVKDSDYSIEVIGSTSAYVQSVMKVGGVPVLIPLFEDGLNENATLYAEKLDALILTGGEDVDPRLYKEAPHEKLGTVSRKRDDFEIALMNAFLKANKKVLGICRGLQLINVAFGGTLYQDIDSQCDRSFTDFSHTSKEDKWFEIAHDVSLYDESLVKRIFQTNNIQVNSIHHQAIKDLGKDLVVTGVSEKDKIIEVIESKIYSNLLAVQWHPETMWTENKLNKRDHLKLFEFLLY